MIDEYHFDKLIIGGSIESLLCSFINNTKILILEHLRPIEVDTVQYKRSLRLLGYQKTDTIEKSEMWNRLSFVLSLNGCLLSPNIIKSHRESDNKIVTITEGNKRITYSSDELIYFDDVDDDNVFMLDWFNVRSGNNHKYKIIEDPVNKFINKIYFYRSQRVGGNSNKKDILAISEFSTKEAQMIEHAEGIARIKTL